MTGKELKGGENLMPRVGPRSGVVIDLAIGQLVLEPARSFKSANRVGNALWSTQIST
jgi:hypothetical protein